MKRCAFFLLLTIGPTACKTTEPASTPTGYLGIDKISVLAKGME